MLGVLSRALGNGTAYAPSVPSTRPSAGEPAAATRPNPRTVAVDAETAVRAVGFPLVRTGLDARRPVLTTDAAVGADGEPTAVGRRAARPETRTDADGSEPSPEPVRSDALARRPTRAAETVGRRRATAGRPGPTTADATALRSAIRASPWLATAKHPLGTNCPARADSFISEGIDDGGVVEVTSSVPPFGSRAPYLRKPGESADVPDANGDAASPVTSGRHAGRQSNTSQEGVRARALRRTAAPRVAGVVRAPTRTRTPSKSKPGSPIRRLPARGPNSPLTPPTIQCQAQPAPEPPRTT